MTAILPSIDPSSIATTIEANINAYLLSFARLPNAILHDGPHSAWIDSGIADATFNSVVRARFDSDGVYRRIGFREYCSFRRYEWSPD